MSRGRDFSPSDEYGWVEFPGSRLLFFLMGLVSLVSHLALWRESLAGLAELFGPGGSAGRSRVGHDEAGKLSMALFLTGVIAVLFFAGALRPRRRADATRPSRPGVSSDGIAAPPGLATTPLECGRSGPSVNRISRPKPHVLVIAPGLWVYLGALACFGFAGILGAYLWRSPPLEGGLGLLAVMLVTFGLGAMLLNSVERHVFDLRRGTYRRTDVLRWGRTIPLSKVRAVQLLTEVPREHKEEKRSRPYVAFQLNLVLDGPDHPRRLLFEDWDREPTIRIGRNLAEFLGLPLYWTALPPRGAGPAEKPGTPAR